MSETDTGVGISLRLIVFSCLHPVIRRTENAVSVSALIPDFIYCFILLFHLFPVVALFILDGNNGLILLKIIKCQDLDVKKLHLIVDYGLCV